MWFFPPNIWSCAVCGTHDKEEVRTWRQPDTNIQLPEPPADLAGTEICVGCYTDGPTLEFRIRKARLPKPIERGGNPGYDCVGCNKFCSFVEPNCSKGYKCPDCR